MTAFSEILDLPVKDRLECMEKLWSSLKVHDLESPDWHKEILDSRRASLKSGEASLISVEELEERLEKLRK